MFMFDGKCNIFIYFTYHKTNEYLTHNIRLDDIIHFIDDPGYIDTFHTAFSSITQAGVDIDKMSAAVQKVQKVQKRA